MRLECWCLFLLVPCLSGCLVVPGLVSLVSPCCSVDIQGRNGEHGSVRAGGGRCLQALKGDGALRS